MRVMQGAMGACVTVVMFSACTKEDESVANTRRALESMIACRDQFTSSVKTIGVSSQTLDFEQRFRLISTAVLQRQQCEEQATVLARDALQRRD
jgi:hypothetical protein